MLLITACGDSDESAPTTTIATGQDATTTIEISDSECSGAEVSGELETQSGLTSEAAATREAVFEAARTCDWDALEELVDTGTVEFSASFGDKKDPVNLWQEQEDEGQDPMRFLATILNMSNSRVEVEGDLHFAWPSAFTASDWDSVTDEQRDELASIYDEEALEGFEEFGGYIGYRTAIGGDGEWLFFLAGD